MDSDDLLGMGLNVIISPQFSVDKWQKYEVRSSVFAPLGSVSIFDDGSVEPVDLILF